MSWDIWEEVFSDERCPSGCGGTRGTPGPVRDFNPDTEPPPPVCPDPFHSQPEQPEREIPRPCDECGAPYPFHAARCSHPGPIPATPSTEGGERQAIDALNDSYWAQVERTKAAEHRAARAEQRVAELEASRENENAVAADLRKQRDRAEGALREIEHEAEPFSKIGKIVRSALSPTEETDEASGSQVG